MFENIVSDDEDAMGGRDDRLLLSFPFGDGSELDVGGPEELVDMVHLPCPLTNDGGAVPGEVPKIARSPWEG